MSELYLLLGSNLGDRTLNISNAIELISKHLGPVTRVSSYYETEPWGNPDQGFFLNAVLMLYTSEDPFGVLEIVLSIEKILGRTRTTDRNAARTIDIDILLYGDRVISTKKLSIPHPRMHLRRFVLVPLLEIAPDLIHPATGKHFGRLLHCCPDKLAVYKPEPVLNLPLI